MRVLWLGDAGCHTGFAKVTHEIGDRLVMDYGHDVSVLAVNYKGDYWPTMMKLYAASAIMPTDLYGLTRYVDMIAETLPEVIVMVNDPGVILSHLVQNEFDTEHVLARHPAKLFYMPIDGYNNPPAWDAIGRVGQRVAMSHFGSEAMGGAPVVYHGIDTEVFKPTSKKEAKRELGFDPDRFLILRTDKNSWRKNYSDTWRALRPVLRQYTDIDVHFHCQPKTPEMDLKSFISVDEDIRDRVTFSPNLSGYVGWDEERLALLYSAADLYVTTSWGEGFGLTLAEAMACGTPVIAQDVSAITEVVGPGGSLIPPQRPIAVGLGQDQMLPDVDLFTEEIRHLYLAGGVRRKLALAGREHVVRNFSWDFAARRFHELITELGSPSQPQEETDGEVQHLHGAAQGV